MAGRERGSARRRRDEALLTLARLDKSDWREAARTITRCAATALDLAGAGFWRFDSTGTELACEHLWVSREGRHESGVRIRAADFPTYFRALTTQRVLAAEDACRDPRTAELAPTYLRPRGITSMMDVAVWWRGRVVGVLCHEHAGPTRDWSPEDEHFSAAMAEMVALALEASARREAEVALDAERTLFHQVLSQMPAAVVIADTKGRIVLANEEASRAAAVNANRGDPLEDYLAGQPFRRADGTRCPPAEMPLVRALERGEVVAGEELQRPGPAGSTLSYVVHAAPIRDAAGHIVAAVEAATEITRQKDVEARLASEAKLRETFLGVVGHDLRNPLAAIRFRAQFLAAVTRLPDPVRDGLRQIDESAQRMGRLIGDLLEFGRGRAGPGTMPVARKATDLAALAKAAVAELRTSFPAALVEVETRGDTRGVWDADRLLQVLSNLVGNALAHGEPGRPVRVRVDGSDGEVVVTVHNHGRPIPEDLRSALFEPYHTTAHAHDGMTQAHFGLGLFIVHAAVTAHGGTVRVDSSRDDGTTFTVRLPRSEGHFPAEARG